MKTGIHLTGAFGQSQELYKARNEAKRGRASYGVVDEQIIEDTKTIINKQKELDFSFVIDPMFNTYYLFQDFAENVSGVEVGPQENWFNNNVFYWRPQIGYPLHSPPAGFTDNIHFSLFPTDAPTIGILPSPYTLMVLSIMGGYKDEKSAVHNLAKLLREEAQKLVAKGITRIQYDEPAIVVKQSLGSLSKKDIELLEIGIEQCGRIKGATTSLHTYFGDAGPIIKELLDLPVDCIGIDATETRLDDILRHDFSGKEVALGLVDARSPSFEIAEDLAEKMRQVAEKCNPDALYLIPNTGTEYIGWTFGLEKMKIMQEAIKIFENG